MENQDNFDATAHDPVYFYALEDGGYVLKDPRRPISNVQKLRKIALAFDLDTYTLLKHGDPDFVEAWARDARSALRGIGAVDMANAIRVIQGRIPVNEVNRCLSTTGYMENFLKKVESGEVQEMLEVGHV